MAITFHELLRTGVLASHFAVLTALMLLGLHRWHLVYLYLRQRRRNPGPPGVFSEGALPALTVQLPLFNELYVAERLIDAVCELDYPPQLLEIQVLDDSTDETSAVVARRVESWRRRGCDIRHLRRPDRRGFKAGALAAGLAEARGELLAIFDADFVPPRDFVRRLVHHFTDPAVGMVQARWGHLNAEHSALTRVQACFLDGHFIIEQAARNGSGRFFNFNGTAGIWRRRAIEEAGGWQHDTLTEDLDLSYRAQLLGWRFVFLTRVVAPAELPVEMSAFKSQQHRWAKGSIQTARKLLPRILASSLPRRVKLEASAHLLANAGYLLVVLLALLSVPAVWLRGAAAPPLLARVDLALFGVSLLSMAAFYLLAGREACGRWSAPLRRLPCLVAVGIGLSLNNARAVLQALRGTPSEFTRTPKYNLRRGEALAERRYRGRVSPESWVELGLAVYFITAAVAASAAGLWGAVPLLLMFGTGYGYVALAALIETPRTRAAPVVIRQRTSRPDARGSRARAALAARSRRDARRSPPPS